MNQHQKDKYLMICHTFLKPFDINLNLKEQTLNYNFNYVPLILYRLTCLGISRISLNVFNAS